MKKKIFALALMLLIGGLSVIFFNACDKDTNCYVKVTVLYEVTKTPVSGAFVKIDIDSSYVSSQGTTGPDGTFNTFFSAPAIFNVNVTYETGYDNEYTPDLYYCYRKGSNTIRLKEGDTVFCTVNLEKTVYIEQRH